MSKKILFILIMIFSTLFLLNIEKVEAFNGDNVYTLAGGTYNSPKEKADCESLFGNPNVDGTFANFLQQIFSIIGYAAPVLCLVLSVFDFVKATASQKKDALEKAAKTAAMRVVYAIVLFFLPMLINFLFPLLGWYGTCGIQ